MTAQSMSIADFQDLIDRCGHDLSRWPDGVRQAATQLLTTSPDAQAIQAAARELAALAKARPPVKAPAGLAARIVATALAAGAEAAAADSAAPAKPAPPDGAPDGTGR